MRVNPEEDFSELVSDILLLPDQNLRTVGEYLGLQKPAISRLRDGETEPSYRRGLKIIRLHRTLRQRIQRQKQRSAAA